LCHVILPLYSLLILDFVLDIQVIPKKVHLWIPHAEEFVQMFLWRILILIGLGFLVTPLFLAHNHGLTSFLFHGFNGSNLILELGASVIPSDFMLQVTNLSHSILGLGLCLNPTHTEHNEMLFSFSTT